MRSFDPPPGPVLRLAMGVALAGMAALACGCRRQADPPAGYGQGYGPGAQGAPGYGYAQGYPGQPPQYPRQSPYPAQQQPPGYAAPGGYPNAGPPGQPLPAPSPTAPAPQIPPQQAQPAPSPQAPPNPNDPITLIDIVALRAEAGSVIGELIGALPAAEQLKVQSIPLMADPSPGEVNAYAACDDQGLPLIAITDGLLEVEAFTAQLRATDELFGTQKLADYQKLLAQNPHPGQPLARPGPGFTDPVQAADPRKVARQHVLMDEQLAFVLGHEMGHHYLGHTGCATGSGSHGVSPADLARILSRSLPLFNQPNEVAADIAGTNNLLTTGARRQGAHWTEEGAMLSLGFFAALDQLTASSILFGFQNTHPHPLLREPIVQQTANAWRLSGGNLPMPSLSGILGH